MFSEENGPHPFGSWLAERRKQVGLLQQVDLLAALRTRGVEVTPAAISKWEKGRCLPSLEHRQALWGALGLTPEMAHQVGMAIDGWAAFPSPADPEVAA